ncbi:MAG: FeoB small GTPase domain-containing protein [Clostridia bacterium]|nr:FeoB small GTPase domain-containing protein [Clostridia bacterium]
MCRTVCSSARPSRLIALAGNPNTGKSTVFNALTGLRQHTGNWPGKTVDAARGSFTFEGLLFTVVDLPGTYSLLANSEEERIARDFLCTGNPSATVIVADAACLERNLNLVLQVMEITAKVVVCVNLVDEANRKGISVDGEALARELGAPVVLTAARLGQGLSELKKTVTDVAEGRVIPVPRTVVYRREVEDALGELERVFTSQWQGPNMANPRWRAIQWLGSGAATMDGAAQGGLTG